MYLSKTYEKMPSISVWILLLARRLKHIVINVVVYAYTYASIVIHAESIDCAANSLVSCHSAYAVASSYIKLRIAYSAQWICLLPSVWC